MAGKGQQKALRQLQIGDTIIDIKIPTIINYKKTSAKISDFKGKLLLLDFWSIWCGGCIEALPKLEKLQKQFGDKIFILPIAFTKPRKDVEAFYKKMEKLGRTINLPTAIYDKKENVWSQMFPNNGYPLEIWIDQEGVIKAITESFYVTSENIQKVLNHEQVNLPLALTVIGKKTSDDLLSKFANQRGSQSYAYHSEITGYIDSLKSDNFFLRKRDEKSTRLIFLNTSVVNLFKASVYGSMTGHLSNKQLIVEVKDSSRLFYPSADTNFRKNLKQNTYCYKLVLPPDKSIQEALLVMNRDISDYFNIQSSLEKRITEVWVLKQIEKLYNLNTKGNPTSLKADLLTGHFKMENVSMDRFVEELSTVHGTPIIVNETEYNRNIDLDIILPKTGNLTELNSLLKNHGLKLEPANREIEKLILKKRLSN